MSSTIRYRAGTINSVINVANRTPNASEIPIGMKNRVAGAIPVYGSNGIVGSHNEAIVEAPGLIVGRKGSAGQIHRSLGPFCPIDTTFYVTAADAPDLHQCQVNSGSHQHHDKMALADVSFPSVKLDYKCMSM